MSLLLKNALTYDSVLKTFKVNDLLIENGMIKDIGPNLHVVATETIDLNQKLLLPGFVDMQVHLRVPGQEYKEDLKTGTKAAHHGGFTTIACMPNTVPSLDNREILQNFFELTKNTQLDIFPIAAMTMGIRGQKLANYDHYHQLGIIGITDDGHGVQDDVVMEEIFKEAKKYHLSILQHCEYNHISAKAPLHLGKKSSDLGVSGQAGAAEALMAKRDIELLKKYGGHYHVLHVSSAETLQFIREAKASGLNITCEATPHHLTLIDEDIPGYNTNFKMNPPLRSQADWEALVEGYKTGIIDIMSTDHAPHAVFEKAQSLEEAPFGVIGLETAFPVIYSKLVKTNLVSLTRLIDSFCYKPREIFSVEKRDLKIGSVADLTCVDLENYRTVKTFVSKAQNSPFIGQRLSGFPVLTIYHGNIVYEDFSHE